MRWKSLLWVILVFCFLISGLYATEKKGIIIDNATLSYILNEDINNARVINNFVSPSHNKI